MSDKPDTACCGIYCPDCILFRNGMARPARDLAAALTRAGFDEYMAVESPFGPGAREYGSFREVLAWLAGSRCEMPCRQGGGCSGKPCAVMICAEGKGLEGCWECGDWRECGEFDFLLPRMGRSLRENLEKIENLGPDRWAQRRVPMYRWQNRRKD